MCIFSGTIHGVAFISLEHCDIGKLLSVLVTLKYDYYILKL